MPMRGELPPISSRHYTQRPSVLEIAWSRIVAILSSSDLQAVILFSTVGFLATINAVLYFPDFGETLEQLAVFSSP